MVITLLPIFIDPNAEKFIDKCSKNRYVMRPPVLYCINTIQMNKHKEYSFKHAFQMQFAAKMKIKSRCDQL